MKKSFFFFCIVFVISIIFINDTTFGAEKRQNRIVRVLLVTGGHDYETNHFMKLFQDNPSISLQAVTHPKAHELFKTEASEKYDVVVLYDMWGKISEEAKKDFVNLLKNGKGLVALHHCLASYQDWPEYTKIIGGKYHLNKRTVNGVEQPGSTYKHDVTFTVNVSTTPHRVIRGISDFEIRDETYGNFEVLPDVTPLLTTTEPTSSKTICWTHNYEKARVVYCALGHDHYAYENPNFKNLVYQAIRFVAPRNNASRQ